MSLDLSAIEASLNEVENKEKNLQAQNANQLPPSPLLVQTDELLLELDMKQNESKFDHKFKCKKCKKPEKSKGYFEKQNIKQKQMKKLKKGK